MVFTPKKPGADDAGGEGPAAAPASVVGEAHVPGMGVLPILQIATPDASSVAAATYNHDSAPFLPPEKMAHVIRLCEEADRLAASGQVAGGLQMMAKAVVLIATKETN